MKKRIMLLGGMLLMNVGYAADPSITEVQYAGVHVLEEKEIAGGENYTVTCHTPEESICGRQIQRRQLPDHTFIELKSNYGRAINGIFYYCTWPHRQVQQQCQQQQQPQQPQQPQEGPFSRQQREQ